MLEALLSPWGLGLLGLCVGSFLNVVVHRLPVAMERRWWLDVAHQLGDGDSWQRVAGRDEPLPAGATDCSQGLLARIERWPAYGIARPASHCPHCEHALRWHENLPLLGWLRLRGRCAHCHHPIALRYPLVEVATAAWFAAMAWRFGQEPAALLWSGTGACLIALALIDWDTTLLPDDLTLPLLWAGLLAATAGWTVDLRSAVTGAAAGYLSLWSVYWLFKLATGKEGMGAGDFKLLAAIGAWLGASMIVPVLLLASLAGAVAGLTLKARGSLREGRYVPFGPFLAGGCLTVVLLSPEAVSRMLGWA